MNEVNKTHTVLRYVYRLQVHRHCVTTKTDQIYDRCQRSSTYVRTYMYRDAAIRF